MESPSFWNLQSGANGIYYAARHGHVETLKFLHEKKCPLDVQDKVNEVFCAPLTHGNTHLHFYSCSPHLSAITCSLLAAGPPEKHYWAITGHTFTLNILHTWRENQLLWHFISLFAVAIETLLQRKMGCLCAFAFSAARVAFIIELAGAHQIPKEF